MNLDNFQAALTAARTSLDQCRTDQPVRVRVQFFFNAGQGLGLASPDAENPGPDDVARCVVREIRRQIPRGFDGGDGIAKVDVFLPARR